jgi:hypothetical protein
VLPPATTALGALLNHITGGHILVAPSDSPSSSRPEGADAVAPSDSLSKAHQMPTEHPRDSDALRMPTQHPRDASRPDGAQAAAAMPRSFQPMNINYGLLPDLDAAPQTDANGKKLKGPERGRAKKQAMSRRAIADLDAWLAASPL